MMPQGSHKSNSECGTIYKRNGLVLPTVNQWHFFFKGVGDG